MTPISVVEVVIVVVVLVVVVVAAAATAAAAAAAALIDIFQQGSHSYIPQALSNCHKGL